MAGRAGDTTLRLEEARPARERPRSLAVERPRPATWVAEACSGTDDAWPDRGRPRPLVGDDDLFPRREGFTLGIFNPRINERQK